MRQARRPFRTRTLPGLLVGSAAALLISAQVLKAQGQGQAESVPLTFGVSQSFQALANPDFQNPSSGSAGLAITSLSFGSSTVTPTDSLEFSAGVGIAFTQKNNDIFTTAINSPNLSLRYGHLTLSTEVTAYGRYYLQTLEQLRSPLDFVNGDCVIVLPSNPADLVSTGLKQDVTAGGSLELGRDAKFGLTITASGEQISYTETTDPSLLDLDRATVGLKGRFNYSPQGDLTLGVSASHQLTLKHPQNIQRNQQNLTLGTNYDVSPVLSLSGYVTYEIVDETGEDQTRRPRAQIGADYILPNGHLAFQLGDQNTSLTYQQNLPTGAISATLGHGQDDSGNGTLDQIGVNYSQAINDVSALSLGLFYSSDNGSTTSPDVTASGLVVSYNRQITLDWGMNLGMNYRLRDPSSNGAETASSAGVFLTISRNVNFLHP